MTSILFVTATLEVGGSESKIVRIANSLVERGTGVSIAYLNPPETLIEKVHPNVEVIHLRRTGKYSVSAMRRLASLLSKGYDAAFSVNLYPLVYLIPAAKIARVKDCRTVCLINTSEFLEGQGIWGHLYSPFIRACRHIVFGCESQQQSWVQRYRLPPHRTSHVYNGVNTQLFSIKTQEAEGTGFRRENGIPDDAFVVGAVGRLAPEKNFSLLLRAASKLIDTRRNVFVLLVGAGAMKNELDEEARGYGLSDNVRMPGVLLDVRPALAAIDVFVLPSKAVETFSNAALEAMSMSRPVVMSRIGGAEEMIENQESGFLFQSGDAEELHSLLRLLHDDADLRTRLGDAARKRVEDEFSYEGMVQEYLRVATADAITRHF